MTTQRFIIQLKSGTFPNMTCWIYRNTWGWSRTLRKDYAKTFPSVEEAQDVVKEILEDIRYTAPEINGNLQARLRNAKIVRI